MSYCYIRVTKSGLSVELFADIDTQVTVKQCKWSENPILWLYWLFRYRTFYDSQLYMLNDKQHLENHIWIAMIMSKFNKYDYTEIYNVQREKNQKNLCSNLCNRAKP